MMEVKAVRHVRLRTPCSYCWPRPNLTLLNPRNVCRSETLEEMQVKVFVFAKATEDHPGDVPL